MKKGVAVWFLGSLTFLAGLHALDAFLWLIGNQSESLFLGIYPFIGLLGVIADPLLYLIFSVSAVFLLWGGTTVVALRNPVEAFLGKVLEDGKKENQAETEFLEAKTSVLEMMSETLENNSKLLAGLRDVVFSVRSEVLGMDSLRKGVDGLKVEVEGLKRVMKSLEKEIKKYKSCPACGREVLVDFRLCPYCGEVLLKPTGEDSGAVVLTEALPLSSSGRKEK